MKTMLLTALLAAVAVGALTGPDGHIARTDQGIVVAQKFCPNKRC